MKSRTIILLLLIACILAAGCISSDAPAAEDLPRLEERVIPTPTPAPALAPIPTRTPVPPVEMPPEPTPTPQNTTSTLCDYPPCGRGSGGGGGGGGGGSSGGELPDNPICELPTVLLMLVGIGIISLIRWRERT